jgi:hypothetical protein
MTLLAPLAPSNEPGAVGTVMTSARSPAALSIMSGRAALVSNRLKYGLDIARSPDVNLRFIAPLGTVGIDLAQFCAVVA